MFCQTNSYKGFEYEVHFTGNRGDWGGHKNKFYAVCNSLNLLTDYHCSHDPVQKEMQEMIDSFLNISPKTVDELVDELAHCLHWTGYEDCDLYKNRAKILIKTFMKGIQNVPNP